MTTATMKSKTQTPVKRRDQAANSKRGKQAKKSPWMTVAIFLIFAGLVAYLFSPNLPDSQKSGSKNKPASGFVSGLGN